MMTTPTTTPAVFDFNDHPVRVILRDGAPWFVAADVCRVLELTNSRMAIADLDDDEKADVSLTYTALGHVGHIGQGGARRFNLISESGLYNLIFKSRKAEAKKFRKWVTADVLPSLRQDGHYSVIDPARLDDPVIPPSSFDLDQVADLGPALSLIREVRILHGIGAARQVWQTLPIPKSLRDLRPDEKSNSCLPSLRRPPQQRDPLNSVEHWWQSCLERGTIEDDEPWPTSLPCGDLYQAYAQWCEDKEVMELGSKGMGMTLRRLLPQGFFRRRLPSTADGSRPWGYDIPSLERCRAYWSETMTSPFHQEMAA